MRVISFMCGMLLAAPLCAEPVDVKTAKKMLFSAKGAQVRVLEPDLLSEQDTRIIKEIGKSQPYYGVIAISPDEGLMSVATLAAAQYHGLEPARAAALTACNEKRKDGTSDCVAVAEILPRKYEPRDLQLSVEATTAFNKEFRRKRGEKAFAISRATGQWAFALGQGAGEAATADCAGKAAKLGADDCEVVIFE